MYGPSGLSYYRHADWLGSSRLASTPTRGLYYDGAYGPYGESYAETGESDAETGTLDRSFTGQTQDTVSGLYDFLFRRYSPVQGRWISPDPAGLAAVNPADPQSWNRYAYVMNRPMGAIDPLGLCAAPGVYVDAPHSGCLFVTSYRGSFSYLVDGIGFSGDSIPLSALLGGPTTYLDLAQIALTPTAILTSALWGEDLVPWYAGIYGNSTLFNVLSMLNRATIVRGDSGEPCTLERPSGDFSLGSNALPLFKPAMADALGNAFESLNSNGITPMITTGFRNAAQQQLLKSVPLSLHQMGLAVDINSKVPTFDAIRAAMTSNGLTWGGTFRTPKAEPWHFQLPRAGTKADKASVHACLGDVK